MREGKREGGEGGKEGGQEGGEEKGREEKGREEGRAGRGRCVRPIPRHTPHTQTQMCKLRRKGHRCNPCLSPICITTTIITSVTTHGHLLTVIHSANHT